MSRTGTVSHTPVDGSDIAYEALGTGEPTVVFIHGIFGDRSLFAAQLAILSGQRHVVAVDLRGHGDSSPVDRVSLDDFAQDVVAVADDLGVQETVLCGHSMGGVVALKVARLRPRLVRGVVMMDGTVLLPEPVRQMGLAKLVPALATDGWRDALEGYFANTILSPQDPVDLRRRVLSGLTRANHGVARTFFADLLSSDHAAELVSAECPILCIHSKAPIELERLSDLRPDAIVAEVDRAGHYAMITAPDAVNTLIEGFVDAIGSTGSPNDPR